MRNHLGISIRREPVSPLLEFAFEGGIILDDTIVDYRDFAMTVTMRVGILIARNTVGCPPGMADPDYPFYPGRVRHPLRDPSLLLFHGDGTIGNRDSE